MNHNGQSLQIEWTDASTVPSQALAALKHGVVKMGIIPPLAVLIPFSKASCFTCLKIVTSVTKARQTPDINSFIIISMALCFILIGYNCLTSRTDYEKNGMSLAYKSRT